MPQRTPATEQELAVAAQAARESHPYNDPRANYEIAATARTAQQQGVERRAA